MAPTASWQWKAQLGKHCCSRHRQPLTGGLAVSSSLKSTHNALCRRKQTWCTLAQDMQHTRRLRMAVKASQDSVSSVDSQDEDTIKELLERLPERDTEPWVLDSTEQVEFRAETVALYVAGAVAFGLGIWGTLGPVKAQEYFAGYLLEQSLSIDNLFVFILVFNYFQTPLAEQGKVLTWGLLTAAVLRLGMIVIGVELIDNFQPVLLLFAGVLLFSSWGLLTRNDDDDNKDLTDNNIVKLCRRFLTVTESYDDGKFFTVKNGVRVATPLLLVLAVIEISDVVFAVDSIPAVFGVTTDPFIIWTSNMWALLSLRSLYSFVAVAMSQLRFLDKAVAIVLAWISVKLGAEYFGQDISTGISLGIVASTLAIGVAASFLLPAPELEK